MKEHFGYSPSDLLKISAKQGLNISELCEELCHSTIPIPELLEPPRVKVIDLSYSKDHGATYTFQVLKGPINSSGYLASFCDSFKISSFGFLTPEPVKVKNLQTGSIGFLEITGDSSRRIFSNGQILCFGPDKESSLKNFDFWKNNNPEEFDVNCVEKSKSDDSLSIVFSGVYPLNQAVQSFAQFKVAVDRLRLNDPSVTVEPENNLAFGYGLRLGFSGILHMEVFCQRLQMEFGTDVIITSPVVRIKVHLIAPHLIRKYKGESTLYIESPDEFVRLGNCVGKEFTAEEPLLKAHISCSARHLSDMTSLVREYRGDVIDQKLLRDDRYQIDCVVPMMEIVLGFHADLKSLSNGFASFHPLELFHSPADLCRLDIFLNDVIVPELSRLVVRSKAQSEAKRVVDDLAALLERHLFVIAVQGRIDGRNVSRATVKATSKDVTAKCYGGDITRKQKLLKQQAEGKRKLRQIGNVTFPPDLFVKMLQKKSAH